MELSKYRKSYWVRASPEGTGEGIVVVVAWMFSERRHLQPYTRLYADSRCDSLVCHPHVLNLWFPSRAEALAVQILDEVLKEVESKPRPIVFATFSGGAKACLYKIFQWRPIGISGIVSCSYVGVVYFIVVVMEQILQTGSKEETGSSYAGKYDPVKACVRGQIHDSSPVDFVSDLGARFATFSVSQRLGRSVFGLPAMSHAVANILDALFWRKFELHREDYWFTLKESSKLGPLLILCCTNDDLAPFDTINKFATVVRDSGCPVELVVWDASDHVGHFRNFPKEYHAAVKTFLDQRLAHAIGRSPNDTATMTTQIEINTPNENSEMGIGTQSSRFNSANMVATQETCCRSRKPLLNSKL